MIDPGFLTPAEMEYHHYHCFILPIGDHGSFQCFTQNKKNYSLEGKRNPKMKVKLYQFCGYFATCCQQRTHNMNVYYASVSTSLEAKNAREIM